MNEIIVPFKALVLKVPRLNDKGKDFYKRELQGHINKVVPVVMLSFDDDGSVNHAVIRLRNDTVTTLFPEDFISNIEVMEVS